MARICRGVELGHIDKCPEGKGNLCCKDCEKGCDSRCTYSLFVGKNEDLNEKCDYEEGGV